MSRFIRAVLLLELFGLPYQESIIAEREAHHQQRNLFRLHARTRALGYQLIPITRISVISSLEEEAEYLYRYRLANVVT